MNRKNADKLAASLLADLPHAKVEVEPADRLNPDGKAFRVSLQCSDITKPDYRAVPIFSEDELEDVDTDQPRIMAARRMFRAIQKELPILVQCDDDGHFNTMEAIKAMFKEARESFMEDCPGYGTDPDARETCDGKIPHSFMIYCYSCSGRKRKDEEAVRKQDEARYVQEVADEAERQEIFRAAEASLLRDRNQKAGERESEPELYPHPVTVDGETQEPEKAGDFQPGGYREDEHNPDYADEVHEELNGPV